jgi:hypothetical protein
VFSLSPFEAQQPPESEGHCIRVLRHPQFQSWVDESDYREI